MLTDPYNSIHVEESVSDGLSGNPVEFSQLLKQKKKKQPKPQCCNAFSEKYCRIFFLNGEKVSPTKINFQYLRVVCVLKNICNN